MNETELKVIMKDAFGLGYRLIDTATNYRNEAAIGSILKDLFDSGVINRKDLFITSKLGKSAHNSLTNCCSTSGSGL